MLKNVKKLLICTKSFSLMLLLSTATHIGADQTSQPVNPVSKAKEQLQNLLIRIDIPTLEELNKDLKETRYKSGKCKNKNMDHEVQGVELLQEIEGLKKELKAC